jgi:hypothetical protein
MIWRTGYKGRILLGTRWQSARALGPWQYWVIAARRDRILRKRTKLAKAKEGKS